MKGITKILFFFSSLLLLSGCLVGPNYTPPNCEIPDEWSHLKDAGGVVQNEEPSIEWWKVFSDPLLDKYMELTRCYNNDLKIALSTILQARANRQIAASQLFPQINADFNVTRTYFSKNGPIFSIQEFSGSSFNPATGIPFNLQTPQIQNLYNALLDASWEIDIFGKIRRSVEAACAQIGQAVEERNDLLISLYAEIARNYIDIRYNQQKGKLIEQDITLLENSLSITQRSLEVGYRSLLDVDRLQAELDALKADLPSVFTEIYRGIYTISILTGQLPEALLEELLPFENLPTAPLSISIGFRSDLLRRRPDIRAAERQLAAATANVGVAVAAFFPTFSIEGIFGFQSLALRQLFRGRSITWALGGDANLPVFQGGNLIGNLRFNEAAAIGAAYNYQQTVLNALQDAETALVAFNQEREVADDFKKAVDSSEKVFSLTNQRYIQGLDNLINLIDSQRQLISREESLLTSQSAVLSSLITLYKALGGGWECSPL